MCKFYNTTKSYKNTNSRKKKSNKKYKKYKRRKSFLKLNFFYLVKGTHARPLEHGSGSDISTHCEAAGAPSVPCPASNLIFND